MSKRKPQTPTTVRARKLRVDQTRSEGLLWSIVRARQLSGLKFRRQHPFDGWFVDFACPERKLIVEVDGGYHDATVSNDLSRDARLRELGWTVLRFTAEDVECDAESVALAIVNAAKLPHSFVQRQRTGSGMKSVRAATRREPS